MKRFISILSLVFMMISVFSCGIDSKEISLSENISEESSLSDSSAVMATPESIPETEPSLPDVSLEGEISVLVLGDSIARGYGLRRVESQRFSALIESELKKKFAEVNMANYGVDGMTGAQLVDMLKTNPPDELADAQYILISIGGNNVLGRLGSLKGLQDLYTEIDPRIFLDYFRYIVSKTEEEKKIYDYARETLNMLFKSANQAFESDEYKNLTATAKSNLEKEIPQLISLIRNANPDAEIIIQTVYNPYKGIDLRLKSVESTLDLHKFGDMAVSPLNDAIESMSESQGYRVAPIRDGFELSARQLTNAGFDILKGVFGVDPHPNAAGHALIAEIYLEMLLEE